MPCSNCKNFTFKEKDCGFCSYYNFHVNMSGVCEQHIEAFDEENTEEAD